MTRAKRERRERTDNWELIQQWCRVPEQRLYPKLQILTIEELLHGDEVKMPPQFGTFKQAQRERQQPYAQQGELDWSAG